MAAFGLHFAQITIAQNTSVLERCQPRTSDTVICAFRKVSGPVSGLIYQELAILSHFLAQQLEITLFGLPCGPSMVASQLEFLIL